MRKMCRVRVRMIRPARMIRIEGLMMRKEGVLGMTVVGEFIAPPKDLTSADVRKMVLQLDMMNDEGRTFLGNQETEE
jgi:hypothetical protein